MSKKLVALLVAGLMMASFAGCAKKEAPVAPTTTPVATETPAPVASKYDTYANPDRVISAEKANEIITAGEKVAIFDIRKEGDFKGGHIAGAVNLFRTDYESTNYEYGGMALERDAFAKLLGEKGVDADTKVVVYGDKEDLDAARFAWLVDLYGHKNVTLIDGGIKAWEDAKLPTTKEVAAPTAVEFAFAEEMNPNRIATLEEVKAAVESKDPNVVIIDTRSDGEYEGKEQKKGAFRKGRIPGAVHIEYKNNIGEDGFKTAEELRKLYEDAGVTPDKTVISYCQSGVRSGNTTYVLSEILGYENVKNYDGSWIEWSFNEDLPIE